jgi:flagellin-like hook-associated protein FlgL
MSTTATTTNEAEGFSTAEASVAALNATVDDAVNALASAIEAAETVVAKFGMTIVRNNAPHFVIEHPEGASPRKRVRSDESPTASSASITEAVAAAETATVAASSATEATKAIENIDAAIAAVEAACAPEPDADCAPVDCAPIDCAPVPICRSLSG